MRGPSIDTVTRYMNWFFSPDAAAPEGETRSKPEAATWLLGTLFLKGRLVDLTLERRRRCASQWRQLQKSQGDPPPDLDIPKWQFLQYLSSEEEVLFHGSSRARVGELLPGPQTRWDQVPIKAMFATSDPIWPIFFATMNWDVLTGSVRNGGFLVDRQGAERFYFFSADAREKEPALLKTGHVHIVSRSEFSTNPAPVRFDEWHRERPVPVLATLQVDPEDFPFREMIGRHDSSEDVQRTWLSYKGRLEIP